MTDQNLELVKSMGSKKGYDPIPPDQYSYFLTSTDPVQKVVAWVRANTIGVGHRSPFAVAKNSGRPLTKADLARACFGGDRSNAGKAWDLAAATGLVREDEKGRLCLCGSVKAPKADRRREGEGKGFVHTTLSPYLIEQIEQLPAEKRESVNSDHAQVLVFRKQLETDALTLARIQGDHIEDSMWEFHGLRKTRGKKKRPELHKDGSPWLQMKLLLIPDTLQRFVQTTDVQTTEPVGTNHENGSAQTLGKQRENSATPAASAASTAGPKNASELQRSSLAESKSKPSSSSKIKTDDDALVLPSKQTEDWDAVGLAGGLYFTVDDAWVRKLVPLCKARVSDITPAEIAQLVHTKGPLAIQKKSPGGFLLTAVPNLCEGESFRRLRERLNSAKAAAPTCACGGPINVDGQCWACYEGAKAKGASGD